MSRRRRLVVRLLAPGLCAAAMHAQSASRDTTTFHADAQRTGWRSAEPELTHERVAGPDFGLVWESPPLDYSGEHPPRLYASPLYVDSLKLAVPAHAGRTLSVVFAASSNAFVYAVNAFEADGVPAGTILWRTRLGDACRLAPVPLDGVLTGILSTPVIDPGRRRLYVTSCDPEKRWQAWALDLASGQVLPGWPVMLDEATFNAPGMNRNAGSGKLPARRFDYRVQRGALNLGADGATLFVTFGDSITGWLVAVDTARARVSSAFATVAEPHHGSGGIWGAGGASIDPRGDVLVVTGSGFNGFVDQPHDWVQSVLKLAYTPRRGFALRGTYTPFNYCETANADIDLGSGGLTLVPGSSLAVVGGKQGNVYLLDGARLPGRLDRRQPCSTDSASDQSLLPPEDQPQFGRRGPLNVFGPYSEKDGALDLARARSLPAYFRDGERQYVFVTGTTKRAAGAAENIAPSLAKLRIAGEGRASHLRIDRLESKTVMENPGSPVITSHGAEQPIVWVLDENARRMAPLAGRNAPQPVLYAFAATSLELLWRSEPGELATSGKYNEPAFARGLVLVGTDRVQAFGAIGRSIDGAAVYRERCAVCHDEPEGRTPPRELLAVRSRSYLAEVVTSGIMRDFAAGLSSAQVLALARYLAKKPD